MLTVNLFHFVPWLPSLVNSASTLNLLDQTEMTSYKMMDPIICDVIICSKDVGTGWSVVEDSGMSSPWLLESLCSRVSPSVTPCSVWPGSMFCFCICVIWVLSFSDFHPLMSWYFRFDDDSLTLLRFLFECFISDLWTFQWFILGKVQLFHRLCRFSALNQEVVNQTLNKHDA